MERPTHQETTAIHTFVIFTDPKRRGHAMPWGREAHVGSTKVGQEAEGEEITGQELQEGTGKAG